VRLRSAPFFFSILSTAIASKSVGTYHASAVRFDRGRRDKRFGYALESARIASRPRIRQGTY